MLGYIMQWKQPVEGSYGIQSTDFIMCSVLYKLAN